jgi:hypothetical protein
MIHHASKLVAAAALLVTGTVSASDLSYTFVDFGAISVSSDAVAVQSPALGQTVAIEPGDGDGLSVAGSLAIGRRFYAGGSFQNSVVDVEAQVMSPLATATLTGNFDLVSTRAMFGYVQPIGERLDIYFEVSHDTVEYDFGSFAGENFDTDDSGAGFGVGVRFNPNPSLELFAGAHGSSVGAVDLNARTFDSDTTASAGLRWYFFEDLGLGVDYRSGDADSLLITLRFGFGELRAGGNR